MAGGAILSSRNDKTLSDWVKDIRHKKMKMKRKVRRGVQGLRVCAILETALRRAEKELRQKQQERYNRWSELQYKLIQTRSECPLSYCSPSQQEEKRKQEIAEVWKSEINSLDEFMRSMSNQKCVDVSS